MVMPTPRFLVFHWPQFTPMHFPFFIGYCFTPTYCVFSDNHSVDFLHSWMYLSKHPLRSSTSAGQGDIPVLCWFYQWPDVFITTSVDPRHLEVTVVYYPLLIFSRFATTTVNVVDPNKFSTQETKLFPSCICVRENFHHWSRKDTHSLIWCVGEVTLLEE